MLIDVRAHHLINILYCLGRKEDRERRIAVQLETFVEWRGPGIVEKSRQILQEIAKNPDLRMRIIIGGADGFCDGCSKRGDCQFGGGPKLLDIKTVEALDLEEGHDYSLEEIIEKARQAVQVLAGEERVRLSHKIVLEQVAATL